MNNYNHMINNLHELKLDAMIDNLDHIISLNSAGEIDFIESIYRLTKFQLEAKSEKEIQWCIQWGAFPYRKTIEDFDFNFQPSINKNQIYSFKTLRFIEKAENILFIGSPGVGKTHLAISIGIEAAKQKQQVRFINCNDLLLQLKKAYIEGNLERKLSVYSRYKVLIIDEIGYLPIDKESAHLLFQLINKRYEKYSTIITTNKSLSKWGDLFNDNVLANAILDRLVHHSHIININGKSYRTKNILIDSKNDDMK